MLFRCDHGQLKSIAAARGTNIALKCHRSCSALSIRGSSLPHACGRVRHPPHLATCNLHRQQKGCQYLAALRTTSWKPSWERRCEGESNAAASRGTWHQCRAYRRDGQFGDFSVTQYAPFQQALASTLPTDLNLDFDKTYLSGRRNMSVVPEMMQQRQRVGSVEAFMQYRRHLQERGDNLDLLCCALLIAQHAHPGLDAAWVSEQLDLLVAEVRRAHLRQPEQQGLSLGQVIGQVLYEQQGFQGSCEDYYDPDNTCINVVLEQRRGSPAALSLLHLLIAERVGAWCRVVLMPSHCFLKTQEGPANFLVDAFNKGQVCSAGVVEARLNANWGFSSPVIRVTPDMVSSPRLATKREVLLRVLSNLRESYWGPSSVTGRIRWSGTHGPFGAAGGLAAAGDGQVESMIEHALVITRFMRATSGSPTPTLLRDEGYILSCLGRDAEAARLLRMYLQHHPHAPDKDQVKEFILDGVDGGLG